MFTRMMKLRAKKPDLKILLALGGWNAGPSDFSRIAHDEESRRNFVNSAIEYLVDNKFDGLDLE
jgi:chitinase